MGHIVDQSALSWARPVLVPVAGNIASATSWETGLLGATNVLLGIKSKVVEPLEIVFASADGFRADEAALLPTVNDIGCRSEIRSKLRRAVGGVGLEVARHDVVHAGLGVLRRHVEPDAGGHRRVSVRLQSLGVLQQVLLAIVGAGSEYVGELAVVVVPRKLERPAAIVLLACSWRPSIGIRSPVRLSIVACGIVGAVAADLLHPVEGLGPELALGRVPQTSLLSPVGKNTGQLSPAGHLDGPAWEVRLVAEGGEFGHGPQEVLISVDVVSKREPGIP